MNSQVFRCQNNVINCKVASKRISDKNHEFSADRSREKQITKFLQQEGKHVIPKKPEILTKYLGKKKKYIHRLRKKRTIYKKMLNKRRQYEIDAQSRKIRSQKKKKNIEFKSRPAKLKKSMSQSEKSVSILAS
jgi:hypothetical protein